MRTLKHLCLLALVALALLALQVAWPPGLRWGRVAPDLLLVLTIVLALLNGPITGAAAGALSAVLLLAVSLEPPLRLLFTRTLLGWLAGNLRSGLSSDNLVAHVGVVLLATVAHEGLYNALQFLLSPGDSQGLFSIGRVVNPWLLLHHALWTPLFYALVSRWPVGLDSRAGPGRA